MSILPENENNLNINVSNSLLGKALEYRRLGFSVIPIRANKKPLIKWEAYQKQLATEEEIKKWFSNPNAQAIGIITGKISNLVVIDTEKNADLSELDFGTTVEAKSGGDGLHFYYRYPAKKTIRRSIKVWPEIDVLGDGGYVIAPPSKHPSGNHYSWIRNFEETELKELPNFVIEKVKKSDNKMLVKAIDTKPLLNVSVPAGKRNDVISSKLGSLLNEYKEAEWDEKVWPQIQDWNCKNCKIPLPEDELLTIYASIIKTKQKTKVDLQALLFDDSNIEKISLTGILDGLFYHTVFIPKKNQYCPFLLFEDGTSLNVQNNKGDKYSFIDHKERHLIYKTNEPLWFSESLVSNPDKKGIGLVISQEEVPKKELYENVIKKLKEYYDFYNANEVDLVFSHIVHTYILGLLGKSFYLLLEGEKNTGKSSLQAVMAKLQFNGSFSGKVTIPSLIRKIHFLGATINLDELDKLHKDEKQVAMSVLNSGMYSTGTYEIVNMDAKGGGKNQIKVFNTFSAKTFSANSSIFPDSFISRCIVINTVRNRMPVKSIYGASNEELRSFQNLLNQLFAYCLMNGRDIKGNIDSVQTELSENSKYGRRSDVFAIVTGILKHFNQDYQKTLLYLEERDEVNEENLADNRFYLTLRFIIEKISTNPTNSVIQFTNEELKDYLIEHLDLEDYSKYKPTPKSIGSLMRRHRIINKPAHSRRMTSGFNKGKFEYLIPVVNILELIEISSFEDLKKEIRKFDFDIPK